MKDRDRALDDLDRAIYEWQLWVPGFGEEGQQRLKNASVLVSRCGGLGSVVAYELAAAGVGRLVLAHGGDLKVSDLHRQILMKHEAIGTSRVRCAAARLREFAPRVEVVEVAENVHEGNAAELVGDVDLVVDCAPLFEERLAMNHACVELGRPLVECAMYELEAQITTLHPPRTPCLACWCPQPPQHWKRQFPVFGAVSGTVGCLGAMEAIKVLADLGEPLFGKMLLLDLRSMQIRSVSLQHRVDCAVCGRRR